ncbi:MAG TPA: hypothetical protein VMB48_13105 [Steroidobacteraceae bacterium]|nr:hypothetical protein [Steroidobacteraceae bacterium]
MARVPALLPALPLLFAVLLFALLLAAAVPARGDPAPFDLQGPVLTVQVTRAGHTLPISQVPNLAVDDRIWVKADLPRSQSAHYLLVIAFLRGSTNPPPQEWFHRCDTWKRSCAQGLTVTVPPEAQQVLVFLAPQTGGDFGTLVDAVRGRPGAFVRASQDLNQATLDRSRLTTYLLAVRALDEADPARLRTAAPLLARSLAIKVDESCLQKIPELQVPCLTDGQESLILDDGHSTSIVEALTEGPASDLAMEASYSPQLSYGYFSPYIASVLDIARIFNSLHIAQYQYLAALGSYAADRMSLTLNAPPSFHNPKSVLVAALPAVEQAQLPPLHAVDPQQLYCARRSRLVLPVEGAPLVFSTHYAHDMVLTLQGAGQGIDLPATADPEEGGFVVDTSALKGRTLGEHVQGSLHGLWGFEPYPAPSFQLVNAREQAWAFAEGDPALVAGRDGTVHLTAGSVSCIDRIMLRDAAGKELKVDWKVVRPDAVEVKVPLQEAAPGAATLVVSQFGVQPASLPLHAFSEEGRLDGFVIHAGDATGTLRGSRLDQVAALGFHGVTFTPGSLTGTAAEEELPMVAQDVTAAAALREGDSGHAHVTLKDGRRIDLDVIVAPARPSVALVDKDVQLSAADRSGVFRLTGTRLLPQDAVLTFSVRAQVPAVFPRDLEMEVATADGAFSTRLTLASGGITLADSRFAVATLDPARAFGESAFGPLQFRIWSRGIAGNWQPLATLVRLPVFTGLECPATPDVACRLSGSGLYLVDAISGDAKFHDPVRVPDGFPGFTLPVPHPDGSRLYVKLRDDPSVINVAALDPAQVTMLPAPAQAAERHAAAAEAGPATAVAPAEPPVDEQPSAAEAATSQPPAAPPGSAQSARVSFPPAVAPSQPALSPSQPAAPPSQPVTPPSQSAVSPSQPVEPPPSQPAAPQEGATPPPASAANAPAPSASQGSSGAGSTGAAAPSQTASGGPR